MAQLQTTSDLLVGQWQDSPRLRAAVDAPLDTIREDVLPAFDTLRLMRDIDKAEGVWLDYLGVRVGLRRPSTTDPGADPRFGFTLAGTGFDQEPFRGEAANDAVYPLPDVIYRRFVKARALLVLGDGTYQTFAKAVRVIDPAAGVQDRRDMSVRIVTAQRVFLELADASDALPRTAGVELVYADRGRFGFDDAGEPFDQGNWTPA